MAFDDAVAIILIGSIFLIFKFADSLEIENEYNQAMHLLCKIVGLFMIIGSLGWAIKLQETTAGVDPGLPGITIGIFEGVIGIVGPIIFFFMIVLLKKALDIWHKKRKGKDFGKDN